MNRRIIHHNQYFSASDTSAGYKQVFRNYKIKYFVEIFGGSIPYFWILEGLVK